MAEYCSVCGARTVSYNHKLTEPMVRALAKLGHAGGGPINIAEIGLTHNEHSNFFKLKYWGVVERVVGDDHLPIRGVWQLTVLGEAFLARRTTLSTNVWTYRNEVIEFEGEQITADQAVPGYQQEWPGRPIVTPC